MKEKLIINESHEAWGSLARKMAHEIKNPLTPIQLASDRLRKKFKPKSTTDSERFEEYVNIISRQVDDIGRMVDEFSAFARMPQPVMEAGSLYDLVAGQIKHIESKKL